MPAAPPRARSRSHSWCAGPPASPSRRRPIAAMPRKMPPRPKSTSPMRRSAASRRRFLWGGGAKACRRYSLWISLSGGHDSELLHRFDLAERIGEPLCVVGPVAPDDCLVFEVVRVGIEPVAQPVHGEPVLFQHPAQLGL